MTFNKFWVLLMFVFFYLLFFQNCIMYAACKFLHDEKKILENMIMIIIKSCNQWVFLKMLCCRYYLPGKIKLFFSVWSTTGKKCFTFMIFWELKIESFGKQLAKRILRALGKRKTFYKIILAIKFYYGGKKELLSVECYHEKNLVKSDMVKLELRVESL